MLKAIVKGSIVEYIEGEGAHTDDEDLQWEFQETRFTSIPTQFGLGYANDQTEMDFLEWCMHLDPEFTIETDNEETRVTYRIVTEGDVLTD